MTSAQSGRRPPIAALALAALLAACHAHDDDHAGALSGNPPPAATDAFIAYVSQVVATQDDSSEPGSIDGVAATAPEDTEPQPLPGP